jgi:hypothetical protein
MVEQQLSKVPALLSSLCIVHCLAPLRAGRMDSARTRALELPVCRRAESQRKPQTARLAQVCLCSSSAHLKHCLLRITRLGASISSVAASCTLYHRRLTEPRAPSGRRLSSSFRSSWTVASQPPPTLSSHALNKTSLSPVTPLHHSPPDCTAILSPTWANIPFHGASVAIVVVVGSTSANRPVGNTLPTRFSLPAPLMTGRRR